MKTSLLIIATVLLLISGCKKDIKDPVDNFIQVGDAAKALLSAERYDHLVIEIGYVDGYQPQSASVNNIVSFLNNRINKPGGISVTSHAVPARNVSFYTINDIREMEQQYRRHYLSNDTITAFFLFLDKGYEDDNNNSKILGVAHGATSMAIFQKTIQDLSGGLTQPSREKVETTVMNHELGHIMGLVDVGTPMQQFHKSHGSHCDNSNCLMYYASETSDVIANLLNNAIPNLDQNCIDDLKANGGK